MICTQCNQFIREGETLVIIQGRPYHPFCSYKAAMASGYFCDISNPEGKVK